MNLVEYQLIRSSAWRLGRFLYRWARRERDNNPHTNGEYWLLDLLIDRSPCNSLVLLDIGANKGDWSARAIKDLRKHKKTGLIHAFEPTCSTYEYLAERFKDEESIKAHHLAISNQSSEATFYVHGPLAGRNSLHQEEGTSIERVQTETLDDLIGSRQLAHVAMVKSDTEGHDFSVIEGGYKALKQGSIDVWQFEYNHRWAANKASLKSVFELVENAPYRIGKLYGNGIELYEEWHLELDRFFATNYVLIRKDSPFENIAHNIYFDRSNVARLRK